MPVRRPQPSEWPQGKTFMTEIEFVAVLADSFVAARDGGMTREQVMTDMHLNVSDPDQQFALGAAIDFVFKHKDATATQIIEWFKART